VHTNTVKEKKKEDQLRSKKKGKGCTVRGRGSHLSGYRSSKKKKNVVGRKNERGRPADGPSDTTLARIAGIKKGKRVRRGREAAFRESMSLGGNAAGFINNEKRHQLDRSRETPFLRGQKKTN